MYCIRDHRELILLIKKRDSGVNDEVSRFKTVVTIAKDLDAQIVEH
jgi:hypothetical protein